MRLAVSKILRRRGFDVIEASDGRAGVDQFVAHQLEIDTVLLDMTLPGISGPEVLRELQRIRPDVKVILTTAYSRETAFAALGDCEPWGFIRKPYRLDELAKLLHTACLQKSQ